MHFVLISSVWLRNFCYDGKQSQLQVYISHKLVANHIFGTIRPKHRNIRSCGIEHHALFHTSWNTPIHQLFDLIQCKRMEVPPVVAMKVAVESATVAAFQRFRRLLFHDASSNSVQVFPYRSFPVAKIGVVQEVAVCWFTEIFLQQEH